MGCNIPINRPENNCYDGTTYTTKQNTAGTNNNIFNAGLTSDIAPVDSEQKPENRLENFSKITGLNNNILLNILGVNNAKEAKTRDLDVLESAINYTKAHPVKNVGIEELLRKNYALALGGWITEQTNNGNKEYINLIESLPQDVNADNIDEYLAKEYPDNENNLLKSLSYRAHYAKSEAERETICGDARYIKDENCRNYMEQTLEDYQRFAAENEGRNDIGKAGLELKKALSEDDLAKAYNTHSNFLTNEDNKTKHSAIAQKVANGENLTDDEQAFEKEWEYHTNQLQDLGIAISSNKNLSQDDVNTYLTGIQNILGNTFMQNAAKYFDSNKGSLNDNYREKMNELTGGGFQKELDNLQEQHSAQSKDGVGLNQNKSLDDVRNANNKSNEIKKQIGLQGEDKEIKGTNTDKPAAQAAKPTESAELTTLTGYTQTIIRNPVDYMVCTSVKTVTAAVRATLTRNEASKTTVDMAKKDFEILDTATKGSILAEISNEDTFADLINNMPASALQNLIDSGWKASSLALTQMVENRIAEDNENNPNENFFAQD